MHTDERRLIFAPKARKGRVYRCSSVDNPLFFWGSGFAGLLIFLALLFAPSVAESAGVETYFEPIDARYTVGGAVTALPLKEADGSRFQREKLIGKKVVVLAFWLDICDDCIAQMKQLQDYLRKKKLGKKVTVVAVARGADREEIKRTILVAKANKISFKTVFDPQIETARSFGVIVAPSFLIIDARGILRTPPLLKLKTRVRDMDFYKFLDLTVRGADIPPLQFTPPPDNKRHAAMLGKKAPDFTLETMDGRKVGLKDFRGSKLLIYFWHPNCSYCVRQIPRIQEYFDRKGERLDFKVAALVYLSSEKDRSDAGKIRADNGVTFPFLVDDDKAVGDRYAVADIPVAFFVDGKGIVREVREGQVGDYDAEYDPVFLSEE